MILNCPECKSRFLVADNLIPTAGRTVRCGACAHQWHVTHNPNGPETVESIAVETDFEELLAQETGVTEETPVERPAKPTPNVPAIAQRRWPLQPLKIAAPALLFIWCILAFYTYFPKGVDTPVIGAIYSTFGITSTEGLTFADVKMEREQTEGGRTRYVLKGNIVNHTESERTAPMVKVSLNDQSGKSIWSRSYPVNVTLKADESYPFTITNVETSFADRVKSITLDLGNSFELMMR